MKRFLFLFLFLSFALFGSAQNNHRSDKSVSRKDSLSTYRFEVGTDLLWLVDKNSLPGYCLQLKINNRSKKHLGAFRFKIGMNLKTTDTTDLTTFTNDYDTYKTRTSSYFFRSGYQLSYNYSKLKLFWGVDLHLGYYKFFNDYYWRLGTDNYKMYNTRTYTRIQYGLIGFIGASYSITPRVSVLVESNCSMLYSKIKNREHSYYPDFPGSENDNKSNWYDSNVLDVNIIPISTISINIHF
ncbi:MAG: hypothetical protein HOO91_04300 [Bacteroidales bacterium]|nr:hypothetical protein [Bacteroidales bacterium]